MINFKELSKSSGYKSLKKEILKDIRKYNLSFNPSKPTNEYDKKFKWVIDRVKHYSYVTGKSPSFILDNWESKRSYWYMNYYQRCNQPKLRSNVIVVNEKDIVEKLGKKFRCPVCNGISKSPQECTSGKKIKDKVCDWKSYGLFGTLGKGVYILQEENMKVSQIFMPTKLEQTNKV